MSERRPPADALIRFAGREEEYARRRPSYPPAAIDAVLDGLGEARAIVAADVGAGTGISARLLADRGARVIAIEPNDAMRQRGERDAHARVEWRAGTGEATGLPDASVNVVLCAQAFHWLDSARALAEFRRILKPAGRCAVMWNIADREDGASAKYMQVVQRHATDPPQSPWFTGITCPLTGREGWRHVRSLRFANEQLLDREGLRGRALSASYSPASGPRHAALVADLDRLFDAFAREGVVTLRYHTELHLAERA